MEHADDLKQAVREKYARIAKDEESGCGCGPASDGQSVSVGYGEDQLACAPKDADLGLGCGNPIAHARLRPGETVLDLGSGAGLDAFLASKEVGPGGAVIGVDMTPEMIARAKANAAKGSFTNVEFRLGEIESLPVADGSVDAVISNCVINLSTRKDRVFAEALRVLRPGGRLVVSDLVLLAELPPEVARSVDAYTGCVAGASRKEDYLRLVREAGFECVEVVEEKGYSPDGGPAPEAIRAAVAMVRSIKVVARKPVA